MPIPAVKYEQVSFQAVKANATYAGVVKGRYETNNEATVKKYIQEHDKRRDVFLFKNHRANTLGTMISHIRAMSRMCSRSGLYFYGKARTGARSERQASS